MNFKIVHKSDDIIFYSAKHILFMHDDVLRNVQFS